MEDIAVTAGFFSPLNDWYKISTGREIELPVVSSDHEVPEGQVRSSRVSEAKVIELQEVFPSIKNEFKHLTSQFKLILKQRKVPRVLTNVPLFDKWKHAHPITVKALSAFVEYPMSTHMLSNVPMLFSERRELATLVADMKALNFWMVILAQFALYKKSMVVSTPAMDKLEFLLQKDAVSDFPMIHKYALSNK